MNKIFISYRRAGGAELARLFRAELEKRGFLVFLDVEDLRSGPFNKALLREIETSSDFIIILTRGALDRCLSPNDWVRLELAHALKCGTNVIPVLARDFEWPNEPLPDDIANLRNQHGIGSSHEYFSASIDHLTTILKARRKQNLSKIGYGMTGLAVALTVVVSVFVNNQKQAPGNSSLNIPPPLFESKSTPALPLASRTIKSEIPIPVAHPLFALRAVINDPDGYTNVRKMKSVASDIVGRIFEGEEFSTYKQEGNWWQIRTIDGKIGYMHVSRIKIIK